MKYLTTQIPNRANKHIADDGQILVCSIAVPTREELKQKVSESSGELMSKFTSFVETFKE